MKYKLVENNDNNRYEKLQKIPIIKWHCSSSVFHVLSRNKQIKLNDIWTEKQYKLFDNK